MSSRTTTTDEDKCDDDETQNRHNLDARSDEFGFSERSDWQKVDYTGDGAEDSDGTSDRKVATPVL